MRMKMKALLGFLLALLCALALSACDPTEPPATDNGTTACPSTEATSSQTTVATTTAECQHIFGEWGVVKPATCKEEGKQLRTCSRCEACEEMLLPKKEEHVPVVDPAVPATCKDGGLTEGSHCSVCDLVLVKQEIIPATGVHTPAAEQDGMVRCSVCNTVLEDNRLYTVTFRRGTSVLKQQSLKPGDALSAPTPASHQWYVWDSEVPKKMPAKDVIYSVVAIGGDAWGQDTTWEYDLAGTLRIHGKGGMSGFSEESQPWAPYKSEITSLVIDEGITKVGKYAFFGCEQLTKIVIPDSVLSIGDYAFANCGGIREIVLGLNVTAIGTGAFVSSNNLECVTFRGALRWRVRQDNYSTELLFSAQSKYNNAKSFREYISGSFTAI